MDNFYHSKDFDTQVNLHIILKHIDSANENVLWLHLQHFNFFIESFFLTHQADHELNFAYFNLLVSICKVINDCSKTLQCSFLMQ